MGGIAEQILIECRNILPLQWFQFELPKAEGDMPTSWAAGPDAHLVVGRPKPPQRPQMLPGIHRRATWRVIEQPLVQQTPEGEDELLATLRLWCDPRRIDASAEELLGTLVPQMAASVHRARLDREARLDPLTGVPVRRVLEASLQRAYRRACDDGTPMAAIMCDIDFFKRVNDTWGHDAGDEALKLVASTLDATRREGDLCCRYGGEEFTILLERTDGLAAIQLAERLRRSVEALAFFYDGQSIPLTLSLGVAAFPELTIKTASELQLLADEALYEAKERGRNQSLLNVGKGAFLAPPGVPRQESSTTMARPVIST
ncbi:MAG: GGDEF domain-containing protein, partial [Acidobacteriota bacterium]